MGERSSPGLQMSVNEDNSHSERKERPHFFLAAGILLSPIIPLSIPIVNIFQSPLRRNKQSSTFGTAQTEVVINSRTINVVFSREKVAYGMSSHVLDALIIKIHWIAACQSVEWFIRERLWDKLWPCGRSIFHWNMVVIHVSVLLRGVGHMLQINASIVSRSKHEY